MGDLGLTAAFLRRLAGDEAQAAGFLAWADGQGGAWRQDRALWIRERCDFPGDAIVYASERAGAGEPGWAARAATPAERAAFLHPLPPWRGIVVGRTARGLPVAVEEGRETGSSRVIRGGMRARLFERVQGRVANGEILAQSITGSALAAELRSHFERGLEFPRRLRGVSTVDRLALASARGFSAPALERALFERIQAALASGGARIVDWWPLPEREVSITWTPVLGALAGQLIQTRACALTLGLLNAGICVSGGDAAFDVASLASAVARQPGAASHGQDHHLHGTSH